jgi:hypothetical protein
VSGDSLKSELSARYPDASVYVDRGPAGTRVRISGEDWHVFASWAPGPSMLRDMMLGRPEEPRQGLRVVKGGAA